METSEELKKALEAGPITGRDIRVPWHYREPLVPFPFTDKRFSVQTGEDGEPTLMMEMSGVDLDNMVKFWGAKKIKVEKPWKFKIFNLTFGREFNQWFARIDANGHMQRIQHGHSLWFCLKKVL